MYLYGEGVVSCIDIDNTLILKQSTMTIRNTAKHCTENKRLSNMYPTKNRLTSEQFQNPIEDRRIR